MLAKAVATECGTTFFNISASSVVSKWRGDSEKLVRVLFELARHHAPSTVFLDEIDAVMSARDGEGGEGGGGGGDHEASRRMKTELLIQLDGLHSGATHPPRAESESQSGAESESAGSLVFLLAATNLPWSLDPALLRRLEKRVMVPLPSEEAREKMIAGMLARRAISNAVDFAELARRTEGYSGSDVATLCKEMAMRPLRRLMERLDEWGFEGEGAAGGEEGGEGDGGEGTRSAGGDDGLALGEISGEDAEGALAATKPSFTQAHARRYVAWTESFGVAAGG
jgi:katanin p60 ATPase-containing subunit A1